MRRRSHGLFALPGGEIAEVFEGGEVGFEGVGGPVGFLDPSAIENVNSVVRLDAAEVEPGSEVVEERGAGNAFVRWA